MPYRRFRCLLTAVLASLLLAAEVCASNSGAGIRESLQGYQCAGQELILFLDNAEGILPEKERFQLTLNDQEAPVSSVEYASAPVSYCCLVDVSGSLNQEQLSQQKAVLHGLCANLADGDQMAVVWLGNGLRSSGYMSGREEIDAAIDAIETQRTEDTNLYGGIVDSIRELRTSSGVLDRKCLLVLSDGKDDQKFSYTKDEVDRAIRESRIPFYGVAVMKSSQTRSDEWIGYAKILGSFARESAGGVYYNPALDGVEASSVGERISADMRTDLRVVLDLSQFAFSMVSTGTGLVPLKLRYQTDSAVYEDIFYIDTADLRGILPDEPDMPDGTDGPDTPDGPDAPDGPDTPDGSDGPDTPDTPDGPDEPDTPDGPTRPEGFPLWMVLAAVGGGVVLILIIILCILAAGRKKRDRSSTDGSAAYSGATSYPGFPGAGGTPPGVIGPTTAGNQDDIHIDFQKQTEDAPRRKVVFTALHYADVRFERTIPEGQAVTLGRDQRADVILNPGDAKLSGRNSRILLRGKTMLVQDADSTNGTAVNGISLQNGVSVPLESGQTLRMGSYEYRVEF